MDLYPSIDVRAGRVVRLHQGQFDQETVYGDDPVAVAKSFESAGAPWVHVVDLDAARRTGSNREVVTAIASSVSVPVQTGGGVRDATLLAEGLSRVVIGSAAVEDPELVPRLAADHAGKIAVGLDHWDGEVRTRGWEQGSGRQLLDLATELAVPGVGAFVVTDISRDATLQGPDTRWMAQLRDLVDVSLVASGGVGSLDDLRRLRDLGVSGAIVGKAIYERRFTVEEAVAACAT
jgi:phosphoribosylformimino-5-aminoimidazole carboxamide ribotide isomerase